MRGIIIDESSSGLLSFDIDTSDVKFTIIGDDAISLAMFLFNLKNEFDFIICITPIDDNNIHIDDKLEGSFTNKLVIYNDYSQIKITWYFNEKMR